MPRWNKNNYSPGVSVGFEAKQLVVLVYSCLSHSYICLVYCETVNSAKVTTMTRSTSYREGRSHITYIIVIDMSYLRTLFKLYCSILWSVGTLCLSGFLSDLVSPEFCVCYIFIRGLNQGLTNSNNKGRTETRKKEI